MGFFKERWSTVLLNPEINDACDYEWTRRLHQNLKFIRDYLAYFPRMAYIGSATEPCPLPAGNTGTLEFGIPLEFSREEVRRANEFATFHVVFGARSHSAPPHDSTFFAYFEGTPMGTEIAPFLPSGSLHELSFHHGLNYDGIESGTKRWILKKGDSNSYSARLFWIMAYWGGTGDFSK